MHYTRTERETVITFDESCRLAKIYSASPSIVRKMDRLTEAHPETYQCIWREDGGTAAMYIARDYRYIKFASPRRLSEAQKAALATMNAAGIDSRSVSGP